MKNQVKLIAVSAFSALLFTLSSCDKEETGPDPVQQKPVEQPVEQPTDSVPDQGPTSEASNLITDNVRIKGATRVEGQLPEANKAITMYFDDYDIPPVLNEGFELRLDSESEFKGAYIQFRSKDGTVADSYFDVDLAQNNPYAKSQKREMAQRRGMVKKRGSAAKRAISAKFTNVLLDVDFEAAFAPGEFCYSICIYDETGNISEPQEICTTVNAWGGNDGLVGEWAFTKNEWYYHSGETYVAPLGTENCYNESATCGNGDQVEGVGCYTKQYETFTFEGDGTYIHTYRQTGTGLDYLASESECEVVYRDEDFYYTIKGNWTFNEATNQIVLVEYFLDFNDSGESDVWNLEPGDAYVYPLNNVMLDGDTFSYGFPLDGDINGDGQINGDDYGYAYFFERQ